MDNINKLKSVRDRDEENKDSVLENENTKISPLKTLLINKPIVVNNTKQLVEITAETKQEGNKNEPFLVIIDTNMLSELINLPIALSKQSNTSSNAMNIIQPVNNKLIQNSNNQVQSLQSTMKSSILTTKPNLATTINVPKPSIILSNLTDDMFVVETPSFNVPFVYEELPKTSLKEFINNILNIKNNKRDEDENQNQKSLDKKNKNNHEEKCSKQLDTNKKTDVNELENKMSGYKNKLDGSKNNIDEQMLVDESERSKKIDSKSKNVSEKTNVKPKIQSLNYFENPFGKFFMQIGINLVEEHVQLNLLSTQRKKKDCKGNKFPEENHMAINSLIKTLEISKKNNHIFQFDLKMCKLCNFKSESNLVMDHHLETSHDMTANHCYNVDTFQKDSSYKLLLHMDTHNIKRNLEKDTALHQCPNCPFEVGQKSKLNRHLLFCLEKYPLKLNQAPPLDWEPPAKIPRVLQNKASLNSNLERSIYRAVVSRFKQFYNLNVQKLQPQQYNKMLTVSDVKANDHTFLPRQQFPKMAHSFLTIQPKQMSEGIVFKNTSITSTNQPNIIPTPYSMNNHIYQATASTTHLPLSFPLNSTQSTDASTMYKPEPHHTQLSFSSTNNNKKSTFLLCEICDDNIKNKEKLREHMQFIHKVKIRPSLSYNEPIIHCSMCQFKCYTDKGLERHLLGSHGLVTSRYQRAANNIKDGGRCPICSKDFPCKLLKHVSHDHSISLRPANLFYKCKDCILTFKMYTKFENHVYLKHKYVTKNSSKKSLGNQPVATSSTSTTSTSKPSKISDEIITKTTTT